MPFCPDCGAEVVEGARFCAACGHPLQGWPMRTEVVPEEVTGWSWGGFFFGWLWGVCNSVWISLLTLIPYVNLVMAFVLGAKGKEWTWKKGNWTSVEHFQRTQHKWSIAAAVVFSLSCLLIAFIIILAAVTAE